MVNLWCLSLFLFGLLIGSASSQESWDLGSSQDWLSVGPIYHTGPYYYPGYYEPIYYLDYLDYYPTYYPVYYPIYNTHYSPYYYPYYYDNFDHFPLGTFGVFHGGNY